MSKFSDKALSLFHTATRQFQRTMIQLKLDQVKGNQVKAAKELGVSRGTLRKILLDNNT